MTSGRGEIIAHSYVYIEEIVVDFGFIWSPRSVVQIRQAVDAGMQPYLRAHDCPKSLVWVPPTPEPFESDNITVVYDRRDSAPVCTGVIAKYKEVIDLAKKAEYRAGIAHVEIKQNFGFGTSTAKLMVRRISSYAGVGFFKLSVMVEFIDRDDYEYLLGFQRTFTTITQGLPIAWKGSEAVISQMDESPFKNDYGNIITDLTHVAYEAAPLLVKRMSAQSQAIERGLSLSDFLWEFPDHHERIVRHENSPSYRKATSLRGLRLDLHIMSGFMHLFQTTYASIVGIELQITSIPPNPPSCPNVFSSINNLHIDVPHAPSANTNNHDCSPRAQTLNIYVDATATFHGTNSITAGTSITANGSVIILNVNGPVTGDIFSGPIYGGNVGGRNNTNCSLNPRPTIRQNEGAFFRRRFELRAGLGGLFKPRPRRGEALSQEGANGVQ
ncbi:hypothetical protein BDN71DRAFT_1448729 [Pleurotus eryngii]|uniref:Uncharacterized protein n=1 Tax=Pleurotus eryngii TaxID=5323 RepID=A0A9P6D7U7_PLEER|nr:hypothetical protein BDN71DRAFT_1448729 [Pleurotus eryngii]